MEHGNFSSEPVSDSPVSCQPAQRLLRIAETGGEPDVRLDIGAPCRLKAWPWASISPSILEHEHHPELFVVLGAASTPWN